MCSDLCPERLLFMARDGTGGRVFAFRPAVEAIQAWVEEGVRRL